MLETNNAKQQSCSLGEEPSLLYCTRQNLELEIDSKYCKSTALHLNDTLGLFIKLLANNNVAIFPRTRRSILLAAHSQMCSEYNISGTVELELAYS